ncbi:hypothetical protein ACIBH1_03640 [Nonomuraea sp. NPDC050663]|uniref:hypothetical protein n=1 Tax=Nonomuraea sp. NPDC050663 TaxID=3364370 RepID=UPI0037944AB6
MTGTTPGDDESWSSLAASKLGLAPSASRRKRRRLIALGVVFAVAAGIWALSWDYFAVAPIARAEHATQKEIDAAELPFVVSLTPEKNEPDFWNVVLDRKLSASEVRKMTSMADSTKVFSYLKSLGGRPLAYTSTMNKAPSVYHDRTAGDGAELAYVFKLNVLSGREKSVVIDDWKVVDVRCRRSTAKAVIRYPAQGGSAYEGVLLHIPPRSYEPVLTDEVDGQGKPYFSIRRIEVGGGQSSGGLRVESIAPVGKVCTWGISMHYVDVHQKDGWVRLTDKDGKPLVIRTEFPPARPQQDWLFGAVPWTACHKLRTSPTCMP